ncbi:SMAD/FHA domain-containing protein, partial [Eremomyces bilateralis CBS 781.70]
REKERRGGRDRSRSREIQDRDSHNTRRRNRVDVGRDRGHHRSQRHPHSRSRSPHQKRRRRSPSSSRSPSPPPRSRKPLPDQVAAFQGETSTDVAPPVEKEKPNFANTGLLAKESNTVAGTNITLKYHEPPNARKPPASAPWRMYVFKGADLLDTIPLGERTCWLFGREQKVADIFLEHPSNSGQHAVLQFRYVQRKKMDELGFEKMEGRVKPYLMDLESRNGTSLNEEKIGAAKYVELRDGDLVRFGESEREYVLQLPPK